VDAAGTGVVLFGRTGDMVFSTRRSRALLADYFGARETGDRLPDPVLRWVRREDEAFASDGGVPRPRLPLIVAHDGRRLSVRLASADGRQMLLLEERHVRLDPEKLAPLGLTRREREVLAWIAMGKSNDEIASIIGTKSGTIAKHLEHIYQKLGVETRTAAALRAVSTAGIILSSTSEDPGGRD
jgi:DNA-binding CsgD family transcriptional regulator